MPSIAAPDLASRQFKANPYPFYARLRAEAPVSRARLMLWAGAWLVTRYEDVLAVLKDEQFAKNRFSTLTVAERAKVWPPSIPRAIRPMARNMLFLDPPDHARLRALVLKAFTPQLIEQLRPRIQTLCDELLTAAQPSRCIELVREYALPLPLTIIAELLGIPREDRPKFQGWSRALASASSPWDFMRGVAYGLLFMRYLRKLFRRRRADPQDDLVTALVQAEEAGDRLNEDELVGMVFLLLVAGHETTVQLIASGTLALLQHPDQMEWLHGNPSLIEPAIEELLRYTSPIDIATERFTREAVTIGGVTIPRGEAVLAVLGSANRDERQFPQPDTLDLARQPNKHLAFGYDAHFCLGAALARLEVQIAVNTLLRRLPHLRLTGPVESLRWRKGLFLRGLEELPLAF